jgi:hypothetical protein
MGSSYRPERQCLQDWMRTGRMTYHPPDTDDDGDDADGDGNLA